MVIATVVGGTGISVTRLQLPAGKGRSACCGLFLFRPGTMLDSRHDRRDRIRRIAEADETNGAFLPTKGAAQ
jgi:hypothetical protein